MRRLRDVRARLKISGTEASKLIAGKSGTGVTPSYLRQLETGECGLSAKQAAKLERNLGLPDGELVGEVVIHSIGGAKPYELTKGLVHRFIEYAPRDRLQELRDRIEAQLKKSKEP